MFEFPAVGPGDPVRISASTYVAYLQCPDLAKARLEGLWGPDTKASFSGGLAHRLFARHLREGPIDPDRLAQVCREEIGGSTLNYKLAPLGLKPSRLGQVIDEVGALYDRFRRFPLDGFRGAEITVETEPAEGVLLCGSVDAVFEEGRGVRLVDWKTGELGEVLDQLFFYALLWALDRGELPVAVEAVSVLTGERVCGVPDSSAVQEAAERVAELVERLRGAWVRGTGIERRGGPWCRYCGVLEGCPEGGSAVALAAGRARA